MNGFEGDGRHLKLSGIGRVAIHWHRPVKEQTKTIRISQRMGKWFARFSCVIDEPPPLEATGKDIGIDVELSALSTTSEGEQVAHLRLYHNAQRKLRVVQRRFVLYRKGRSNRRNAVAQLQRQHERIPNQRHDVFNKLADDLVKWYDRIALDDTPIVHELLPGAW